MDACPKQGREKSMNDIGSAMQEIKRLQTAIKEKDLAMQEAQDSKKAAEAMCDLEYQYTKRLQTSNKLMVKELNDLKKSLQEKDSAMQDQEAEPTMNGPDYQDIAISMAVDDFITLGGIDMEGVAQQYPNYLPVLLLYYSKAFPLSFSDYCVSVAESLHEMQNHQLKRAPPTMNGPDYQEIAISMAVDDFLALGGIDIELVATQNPNCLPVLKLYYSKVFPLRIPDFCVSVAESLDEAQNHQLVHNKQICYHCGKHSNELKACSWCLKGMYCDRKCQRENWKEHKRFCIEAIRLVDPGAPYMWKGDL